ncbi:MAG: hypothetical protein D6812_03995, partial [Deltaproteobacteria bacterium]
MPSARVAGGRHPWSSHGATRSRSARFSAPFSGSSFKEARRIMGYRIKKVAVLGSGIMGRGIAGHLAGCGLDV